MYFYLQVEILKPSKTAPAKAFKLAEKEMCKNIQKMRLK